VTEVIVEHHGEQQAYSGDRMVVRVGQPTGCMRQIFSEPGAAKDHCFQRCTLQAVREN
jgi:hypothetical protein